MQRSKNNNTSEICMRCCGMSSGNIRGNFRESKMLVFYFYFWLVLKNFTYYLLFVYSTALGVVKRKWPQGEADIADCKYLLGDVSWLVSLVY